MRISRLRCAIVVALAGWYLMLLPADASSASNLSETTSNQITVDGCWIKVNETYSLSSIRDFGEYVREIHSQGGAPSIYYILAGPTSKLDDLGRYVRVSGTFTASGSEGPVGTIRVETVTELSVPDAKLNPSISRISNWQKYIGSRDGVSYSVPKAFTRREPCCYDLRRSNFAGRAKATAVAGFEIPNDTWGASDFAGGTFAIYVAPEMANAATCYKFGDSDADDEMSSVSIRGVRYAHLRQSSIPPEEIHYYHAFENGRCYEIIVDLDFYRMGDLDLGCEFSIMAPETLINLLLTQISFRKP